MEKALLPLLVAVALFLGLVLVLNAGRRLGARRRKKSPGPLEGLGAVEGAVFGLLGLLIAFTFSEAAARFNVRRDQIVQEINMIGTAWLRLDLLPAAAQPAIRDHFRRYVDARLSVFRGFSRGSIGRPSRIRPWPCRARFGARPSRPVAIRRDRFRCSCFPRSTT